MYVPQALHWSHGWVSLNVYADPHKEIALRNLYSWLKLKNEPVHARVIWRDEWEAKPAHDIYNHDWLVPWGAEPRQPIVDEEKVIFELPVHLATAVFSGPTCQEFYSLCIYGEGQWTKRESLVTCSKCKMILLVQNC